MKLVEDEDLAPALGQLPQRLDELLQCFTRYRRLIGAGADAGDLFQGRCSILRDQCPALDPLVAQVIEREVSQVR